MCHRMRSLVFVVTAFVITACARNATRALGPAGAASANASMGASTHAVATTTAASSDLPPMAVMPPPGVRGSKTATLKYDGALTRCASGLPPSTKDPTSLVKRIGEACARLTGA